MKPGSIIQTAERCLEAGAVDVVAMATQLVMAGDSLEKFRKSSVSKVIGSDTYPGSESNDIVDVYSVAPLLADTIEEYLHI